MIKDKYLKTLINATEDEKKEMRIQLRPVELRINFLKTMSDEQITRLGNMLAYFFPKKYTEQFLVGNNAITSIEDTTFAEDFRKDYNISNKFEGWERIRANNLFKMLRENPNLTATEYIEKIGL